MNKDSFSPSQQHLLLPSVAEAVRDQLLFILIPALDQMIISNVGATVKCPKNKKKVFAL